MFKNIEWLFFDVGATIVDEHIAYDHRMREIANLANMTYLGRFNTSYQVDCSFEINLNREVSKSSIVFIEQVIIKVI